MQQERLMKLLVSPHISEKSSLAAERDKQFVFKVARDANKVQIKRAVELMFDVKVASVQVINVKGKSKRFSNINGRRASWKKAYVNLMPGYDIDFLGAQ
ncbi:MAG TPA: 50S ribosomal protein L23 [Gammaproteobacteria bacterium]|nr:50S ribosomal protein L23 [Gammaproteobacteria bacterium]